MGKGEITKAQDRWRLVCGLTIAAVVSVILAIHVWSSNDFDESALGLLVLAIGGLIFALSTRLGVEEISAGGFGIKNKAYEKAVGDLGLKKSEQKEVDAILQLYPQVFPAVGARVLWVDDNPDILIAHRRLLRSLGMEIVVARSTSEAKRELKKDGDFAFVIQDNQRKEEKAGSWVLLKRDARDLIDWLRSEDARKWRVSNVQMLVFTVDQYVDIGVPKKKWIVEDVGKLLECVAEEIENWRGLPPAKGKEFT